MKTHDDFKFSYSRAFTRFRKLNDAVYDFLNDYRGAFEGEAFKLITFVLGNAALSDTYSVDLERMKKVPFSHILANGEMEREIAEQLTHRKRNVVAESLSCYRGKELNEVLLKTIFWRIACGFDLLKEGQVLAGEFRQGKDECLPLRVTQSVPAAPLQNGQAAVTLTFMIMSGVYAGLSFSQRMPYRYVVYYLAGEMGFPKFKPIHYLEMVQCVLAGVITFQDPSRPKVGDAFCPVSGKAVNRELRKNRKECLFDFRWPCQNCTKGYLGASPCAKATRQFSMVKRECKGCPAGRVESWFDPKSNSEYCVKCQERMLFKRAKLS